MTVWLLANVGNSDVQLSDLSGLPADAIFTAPNGRQSVKPRLAGEAILGGLDTFVPVISLPMIGATLHWLIGQNIALNDLQMVLFASDQIQADTQRGDWEKDTLPYAQVIKAILSDARHLSAVVHSAIKSAVPKKQIEIRTIEGNPADYNNLLQFYAQTLRKLENAVGTDDHVYLEVTGGTPAMTAMLILVGVDSFGERTHTLYVDQGADTPYEMGVERELRNRRTRRDLRTQIAMHAYAVAASTLQANTDPTLIAGRASQRESLDALLEYADRRLAFDFGRARTALQRLRPLTTGATQSRVSRWMREFDQPNDQALLAELIHSMNVRLKTEDYSDFIARLFRFQEAMFRAMAESMGMQYSGKNDRKTEFVSRSWLDSLPGITAFSEAYTSPGAKAPIRLEWARSLNRTLLGALVDYFLLNDLQRWDSWATAASQLHALTQCAELRNKGLTGHGFQGIGKEDIVTAYNGSIDELMQSVERIYADVFGAALPSDPYEEINGTITELLRDDS